MTDQDYAEAYARAFNVAAAMPVTFHQEAQALLDLALQTGASFHATEPALRRLCARYAEGPKGPPSTGSRPLR